MRLDPRELGVLCAICAVFMSDTLHIIHKNHIEILKCYGRPVVCDNTECISKAKNDGWIKEVA